MPSERADEQRRGRGAAPAPEPAAAEVDPEHDEVTSREALERELAEQGRSDEAGRLGDHID